MHKIHIEVLMNKKMCISAYGDAEALLELGERLRAERLRRNLTQEHLAGLVGVTRLTMANLEGGSAGVSVGVLAKVLGVLGLERGLPGLVPEAEPPIDFRAAARPLRQRAGGRRK